MRPANKKGVPGVPLHALDSIKDENTRMVLRSLVDGWNVRNGNAGTGDAAFITKSDLPALAQTVVKNYFQSAGGAGTQNYPNPTIDPGQIGKIINELEASIFESKLWKDLGTRINQIDLGLVAEQQARIAAVQQVANNLAAEIEARLGFEEVTGSKISALQIVTDNQAEQISGLTTRIDGAESTIVNLQSTTTTQATSLTALTTRVEDTESNITDLSITTQAQAQSLSSLSTRVAGAESSISTLNTTTANQASVLVNLTTSLNGVQSAIAREETTRANADNAITTSVNTQFAQVNNSLSAIQTQQTTLANSVSSLSQTTTTLQSGLNGQTAALQTEAQTRANADGTLFAQYTVKVDVNGYVSGYGLASTAVNGVPRSDFIVRADRFAIGSPSGPGITPRAPFTVLTTPRTLADGTVLPVGVYIDTAMVRELNATFINAGLLYASKIYTGSQYIDFTSKQPIQVMATATGYIQDINPDRGNTLPDPLRYLSPLFPTMRFYGPRLHASVPENQRVRSSTTRPLVFLVTVTATVNHWLSIWYRKGSEIGAENEGWRAAPNNEFVEEPQPDYGSAALSIQITETLADNDYIEFTASTVGRPSTVWEQWNRGKPELRFCTMTAVVSNL